VSRLVSCFTIRSSLIIARRTPNGRGVGMEYSPLPLFVDLARFVRCNFRTKRDRSSIFNSRTQTKLAINGLARFVRCNSSTKCDRPLSFLSAFSETLYLKRFLFDHFYF
jgi:hypothetical protein